MEVNESQWMPGSFSRQPHWRWLRAEFLLATGRRRNARMAKKSLTFIGTSFPLQQGYPLFAISCTPKRTGSLISGGISSSHEHGPHIRSRLDASRRLYSCAKCPRTSCHLHYIGREMYRLGLPLETKVGRSHYLS